MRILVACALPEFAIEELRSLASDLVYRPEISAEALPAQMAGVNILLVNRVPVTGEAITAGPSLQMIVRAGTDTSTIATDEASKQGIFVCNSPNKTAVAIAEMFFALALSLDRGLPFQFGATPPSPPIAFGLAGRTLGCIGFGPASREICRRAAAFGMDVYAWSGEHANSEISAAGATRSAWPRDVAARADVIASCETLGMSDEVAITAEVANALRPESLVVHIGDWSTIDENAIVQAIRNRGIRFAIDLPSEAGREATRGRGFLAEQPGVLVTHRLAARTEEARRSIAAESVRVIRQFLVSGEVQNCVNLLERSPATWQLVLRLRDAVGVMAGIMETIRSDGINAEEIGTRVFSGARAAWCTIALDDRPSAEALATIRSLPGVLHLELRAVV